MGLLAILFVLAVFAAANFLALVKSRSGSISVHKAMFVCGIVGLLSLVAAMVSLFLAGGFLFGTFDSLLGRIFTLSSSICAISTLGSLLLLLTTAR